MYKYAQIDLATGRCVGVSFLSGEVDNTNLIPLLEEDVININDTYENGVWIPTPIPEPVSLLELKLSELNAACNATILAGFTSSALGAPHTYDFDYEAQTNIGGIFSAIIGGIVTTSQYWKASGVPTLHTTDQLKMLFADGLTHKNSNIGHYWTLKEQAIAAQTPEELASIVW